MRMSCADAWDTTVAKLRRREDRFLPPRRLRGLAGEGDYRETGNELLGELVQLGRIAPHDRVVDIGCGPGRLAYRLQTYLGPAGIYTGIDPNLACIEWLTEAYKWRRDFDFHHIDVRNGLYNPAGAVEPREFKIPINDETQDIVTMFSLMTHMLPQDIEPYLREARRVLIPGGWILVSMFLLDDVARQAIADGSALISFHEDDGQIAVVDPDLPEQAIAYDREWFLDRLAEADFTSVGIRHGTWVPRGTGRTFQDLILARTEAPDLDA